MLKPTYSKLVQSRFGSFRLDSDGAVITQLLLPSQLQPSAEHHASHGCRVLQDAARQLKQYFEGRLSAFDLPLSASLGTDFQQAVWRELCRVPYGCTTSYARLAARIGRPKAVRAVGAANARNPIPIIVPCHRVIGSNGSLTGYAGGIELKQRLLELERQAAGPVTRPALDTHSETDGPGVASGRWSAASH